MFSFPLIFSSGCKRLRTIEWLIFLGLYRRYSFVFNVCTALSSAPCWQRWPRAGWWEQEMAMPEGQSVSHFQTAQ